MKFSLFALLAALFLASCSNQTLAEQQRVTQFHQQFDNRDYSIIWNESDPLYRQAINEAGNTKLFSTIYRKLGSIRNSTLRQWSFYAGTQGKFTTLKYSTVFSRGKAIETFVWHDANGRCNLTSYHIDIPLLPETKSVSETR